MTMNENDKQAEPVAWAEEIIDDLQGQFDTDGITHEDSGDALIYLSQAISSVQDAAKRHRTQPVQPAGAQEPENSLRTDALCQLSYCNGLKAGWNFCVDENEAGFQNAMKGVVEAVSALKESRSQEAPAVAVNEQLLEAFLKLLEAGIAWKNLSQSEHSKVQYEITGNLFDAIQQAEAAKKGGAA